MNADGIALKQTYIKNELQLMFLVLTQWELIVRGINAGQIDKLMEETWVMLQQHIIMFYSSLNWGCTYIYEIVATNTGNSKMFWNWHTTSFHQKPLVQDAHKTAGFSGVCWRVNSLRSSPLLWFGWHHNGFEVPLLLRLICGDPFPIACNVRITYKKREKKATVIGVNC